MTKQAGSKRRCLVVGATGLAGQQLVAALLEHPVLELAAVAASPRCKGLRFDEALRRPDGSPGWLVPEPLPESVAALPMLTGDELFGADVDVAFSAVEADVARELEPRLAERIPVVSTASAFRYEDDVPLLLPAVNADHAELVRAQEARGWKGFIVPIPNCTTTGLATVLAPLAERFGLRAAVVTSMQAVSGAGRAPGVLALDAIDNVVPYIPKEEEKVRTEAQKILGRVADGKLTPHGAVVSATCTRVPVLDGHTVVAAVSLGRSASPEEVADTLRGWVGHPWAEALPSSPRRWIEVLEDPYRPQPRLDRERGNGMVTSVGRIRSDPALENGVKLVLVSHNTKLGAGAGAVLAAELLAARGLL